jgi:hypothetical protein
VRSRCWSTVGVPFRTWLMTMGDLVQQSITQVDLAVFEPDGGISFFTVDDAHSGAAERPQVG